MKKDFKNSPVVKPCADFEAFTELIDGAKHAVKEILCNGRKLDRRKMSFDAIEDAFENKIPVTYQFTENRLELYVGEEITKC